MPHMHATSISLPPSLFLTHRLELPFVALEMAATATGCQLMQCEKIERNYNNNASTK